MEFFGLSKYGFSSPIKDMMRDDYVEPENPPRSNEENKRRKIYLFSKKNCPHCAFKSCLSLLH